MVLIVSKRKQLKSTHHASGPAIHHFRQAKLELAHKLLRRLSYPTIPLQLPDPLGHRQHSIDSLKRRKEDTEEGKIFQNVFNLLLQRAH